MLTGILMISGLIFFIILLSYGLSFALEKNTVTFVTVALIPPLAVTMITPGFMITRGRAHWQRVIGVLNGGLIVALTCGFVASLFLGDTGIAMAASVGLVLVLAARVCYRSRRYQDGVEYYRRIWTIYRQRR
jgi:hypothetical protein